MNGEPLRRTVIISNAQGLHMRPITTFVELAGKFQSGVTVIKGAERFNGKSPLSLLGLGADKGTELIVEVSGPDQEQALEALAGFLEGLTEAEDETAAPPP
jgi:multiphosphoryl transfer protein